jgi:hypothetical protein
MNDFLILSKKVLFVKRKSFVIMKKILILFFTVAFFNTKAQTTATKSPSDTLYSFKNDSLFISDDSIITIGQKLVVGKGSDENGWYRSMRFKSAFAWPLWLFRSSELDNIRSSELNNKYYEQDAEYIRERDKVKSSLAPGVVLEVIKIKKEGNKRRGYSYIVYLKDKRFAGSKYFCNIKLALATKEILMQCWQK